MLSLDKNIDNQKMVTGRTQIKPGVPTKIDGMELISAIAKTAITCSAANERLKSFDQLKFWTSLLLLFVAKALTFNVSHFSNGLFLAVAVQSKEKDMETLLL